MPVWEFQKKYGDRVATLGGVDVDKLARYDQRSLRKYVRSILHRCVTRGRYALGSGNTVTNYVPTENYVAMIKEGQKWKPYSQDTSRYR
jgi:uroporphyrinogen decarboxylase